METDDNDSSYQSHEACLAASKELKRCCHALWSLLPGFCRSPIDVEQSFPKIAKRLGDVLYNTEFYPYSVAALRNLMKCPDESVRKFTAKFGKNYLSILFNIYTNENEETKIEEGMRLPVLKLIQAFIPMLLEDSATQAHFVSFYQSIRSKIGEDSLSEFRRNALLDLLQSFLRSPQGLQPTEFEDLYTHLVLNLIQNSKVPAEQKKGFKILEELLQTDSQSVQEFLSKYLPSIIELLFKSFDAGSNVRSASSKTFALRCIKKVLELGNGQNNSEWPSLVQRTLIVTLDCFTLKSAKAVKTCQDLIRSLASIDQAESVLSELISPLRNDDQITQQNRLSRCMALSYWYENMCSSDSGIPSQIEFAIADVLMAQFEEQNRKELADRQLLAVFFDWIKVFIKHTSQDTLNSYIQMIVCNCTTLAQNARLKFRLHIRLLLVKLIRKFG